MPPDLTSSSFTKTTALPASDAFFSETLEKEMSDNSAPSSFIVFIFTYRMFSRTRADKSYEPISDYHGGKT